MRFSGCGFNKYGYETLGEDNYVPQLSTTITTTTLYRTQPRRNYVCGVPRSPSMSVCSSGDLKFWRLSM